MLDDIQACTDALVAVQRGFLDLLGEAKARADVPQVRLLGQQVRRGGRPQDRPTTKLLPNTTKLG